MNSPQESIKYLQDQMNEANKKIEKLDQKIDIKTDRLEEKIDRGFENLERRLDQALKDKANKWVERVIWLVVSTSIVIVIGAIAALVIKSNLIVR